MKNKKASKVYLLAKQDYLILAHQNWKPGSSPDIYKQIKKFSRFLDIIL
jgi:hypothetical protein